ncbi:MAG: AAA family ATPase [Tenuifilaceae bacterium]|nr:AAA family ATPase [Tenuifilaceae bacterium]
MHIKFPIVYIGIAPAGSGKTTFFNNMFNGFKYTYISADALRKEVTGDASSQEKNYEVFKLLFNRFLEAIAKKDEIIIIDNTSLTYKDRKKFYDIVEQSGLTIGETCYIKLVVFKTSYNECVKRNNSRERRVPEEVILKQFNKLELPNDWERINCNIVYIGE